MSRVTKTGRPSKYDELMPSRAYRLAVLGLDDKQIAFALGISERTLNNWKQAHELFMQSLNAGKLPTDGDVAVSLLNRAKGFSHPDESITVLRDGTVVRVPFTKRYPPDTTACIFWLKNRQRELWRDRRDDDEAIDPTETARQVGAALKKIRLVDGFPGDA